ncbi:hypothetical protein JCM16814_20350 [Desulfobaculum senezii]
MHPLLWWTLFTVAGIWLQRLVPGVDFLAPGLVILMQEREVRVAAWLTCIWILVQEGTGGMAFGSALLWYAALGALFWAGRWLFESTNLLFVMLIGIAMGVWHVGLFELMAQLQDLSVSTPRLMTEGLLQAGIFFIEWAFAYAIYKNWVRHGANAL